jgi:hypothetical protein
LTFLCGINKVNYSKRVGDVCDNFVFNKNIVHTWLDNGFWVHCWVRDGLFFRRVRFCDHARLCNLKCCFNFDAFARLKGSRLRGRVSRR